MNSILTSVKKLLGIAEECTDFDADVVMYVNSALFVLSQIGVGPVGGFTITGSEETWEQFSADKLKNEAVKAYLGVKVRLLGFDPPQSSSTMEAMKNTVAEMEWRLREEFDEPLGTGATAADHIKDAMWRTAGYRWSTPTKLPAKRYRMHWRRRRPARTSPSSLETSLRN